MARIVIIAGPTGSGKSELSLKLAQALHGEIINIDSVQLYKDFIIGSARPSLEEMSRAPHHLFGTIEPSASFDVAQYNRAAQRALHTVRSNNHLPIFVGGTSLYITTLIHGLVDLPPTDQALRNELEAFPTDTLFGRLMEKDNASAQHIHPNDRVRIIRALEACGSQTTFEKREAHGYRDEIHPAIILVPMWERSILYERIERRSAQMVESDLVNETQELIKKYGEKVPALKSIGYAEVSDYLKGKMTREDLKEAIAQSTRRFAKRQMTWLRNEPQKRSWNIRPSDGDDSIDLGGDTIPVSRMKLIKHFRVLDLDFETLAANVQNELNQEAGKTTIWFINGQKVLNNKM